MHGGNWSHTKDLTPLLPPPLFSLYDSERTHTNLQEEAFGIYAIRVNVAWIITG